MVELYYRYLLIKEIAPILGCCPSSVTKLLREAEISPGECFSRSMKLDWRGEYSSRDRSPRGNRAWKQGLANSTLFSEDDS